MPFDPFDVRSHESLVNLLAEGFLGESYYARTDGGNAPYHRALPAAVRGGWVREGVAARLRAADAGLQSYGLRLYVLDGYRPLATQRSLWDFFYQQAGDLMPQAAPDALAAWTRQYVSDPRDFSEKDPTSWPLHITGGAIDVTLAAQSGAPVDLGGGFDEMGETIHTAHYEDKSEPAAKAYRRILYWAMREAGFTNYPYEYFHYDYGTALYALMRRAEGEKDAAAFYGYVPREAVKEDME